MLRIQALARVASRWSWTVVVTATCAVAVAFVGPVASASAESFGSPFADPAAFSLDATPGPMYVISPPVVRGRANVGQTLTVDYARWEGNPTVIEPRWFRCTWYCQFIAYGESYELTAADLGFEIEFMESASNELGSEYVRAERTAPVRPALPENGSPPEIEGVLEAGQALVAFAGAWTDGEVNAYDYEWYRCDGAGGGCAAISHATGSTFDTRMDDIGHTLRLKVTADNGLGRTTAWSELSAVIGEPRIDMAPESQSAPMVVGDVREDAKLKAELGDWNLPVDVLGFSYRWQRCPTDAPDSCADIPGARSGNYTPLSADIDARLRVVVHASNESGEASAASELSAPVSELQAPVNAYAPSIGNDAVEADRLQGDPGNWNVEAGALRYRFQWLRCNGDGGDCEPINNATTRDYTPVAADVTAMLRLRVEGVSRVGSQTTTSDPVGPVQALDPPRVTAPPRISGVAIDWGNLYAIDAEIAGRGPLTTTYTWLRCDAGGGDCRPTNWQPLDYRRFSLNAMDAGHAMRLRVRVESRGRVAEALSAPSTVVASRPPTIITDTPQINGNVAVGQWLWFSGIGVSGTTPLTRETRWERCDADGTGCVVIPDETNYYYTVRGDDAGKRLRFTYLVSNAAGSDMATSSLTDVIQPPAAPAVQDLPVVYGSPLTGEPLYGSTGYWNAPGADFVVSWQRCDEDGEACADIAGATSESYQPGTNDLSHRLRVVVTATNVSGQATAVSDTTAPIADPIAPASTQPPTLEFEGQPRVGSWLYTDGGSWSEAAGSQMTFDVTWLRCDGSGAACEAIDGATDWGYQLVRADAEHTLRVRTRATNAVGDATADSDPSELIAPMPAPIAEMPPSIAGAARTGETLRAVDGEWNGEGEIALTRQWRRCDASGADCADIDGAADATYTLTTADVGHRVGVRVRAENLGGDTSADAEPTAAVAALGGPVATRSPRVEGAARVGGELRADVGEWDGDEPLAYAYRWYRCDEVCAAIDGASGESYVPVAADAGQRFAVEVTVANAAGSARARSALTEPAGDGGPSAETEPSLSGDAEAGATLTLSPGSWAGTPPLSYSYAWERCDENGDVCQSVADAAGTTYSLVGLRRWLDPARHGDGIGLHHGDDIPHGAHPRRQQRAAQPNAPRRDRRRDDRHDSDGQRR